MSPSGLRAGAVQMCSGLSPKANLAALDGLVEEAARRGADYVLTPEMTIAFYGDGEGPGAAGGPLAGNRALDHCAALARRHDIILHLGSLAVALENGKFANRSAVFGPDGAIIATYDKIHLFDAELPGGVRYNESTTYQAGDRAVVVRTGAFDLGMSICYDVRFAVLYRALAEAGAGVIAIPAAFTVPTGRAHWRTLVRARAIETGAFVIAAAQGGQHENGRVTYGHSMIVDPWGRILVEKQDDKPGVIVADVDLTAIAKARKKIPALANRRQFSLSVNHNL